MQVEVRGHNKAMDKKDAEKFKSLYEGDKLLKPEQPGNVMARLVLAAGSVLSGRFLRWVFYGFCTNVRRADANERQLER